jgi:hypothetical protein
VGRLGVALEEGTAGSTSLNGLLPLSVLLFADPEPNEEIGWGGFAPPGLLERAGALLASVALGAGRAAWHLPAFVQRPGNGPAPPFVATPLFAPALHNEDGGQGPDPCWPYLGRSSHFLHQLDLSSR